MRARPYTGSLQRVSFVRAALQNLRGHRVRYCIGVPIPWRLPCDTLQHGRLCVHRICLEGRRAMADIIAQLLDPPGPIKK